MAVAFPLHARPGRHRTSGAGAGTSAGSSGATSRAGAASLVVLRRVGSVVSTLAVVVAAAAFLFLAVGPHVLGYRTATMLTGSMSPGINPGDVVVSVPKPAADVAVGDVISYHIPVQDHRVETHRVVRVTTDTAGRVSVVTKGDANSGADPWVATIEGSTVWQARAVVPHLGEVVRLLRAPLVQGGVFWGALGLTVLLVLARIWAPARQEPGA